MWLVMRRIWDHAEARLAPYSLSLKHNWALHALDEPMSMSALADRLGIDASYVTTIADQLEERGLIERQPHPTDRRIKSLALTPRAGGSARSSRTSYGSRCRSSMRSRPPSDASCGGSSHGPSTRHRETECAPDRQHLRGRPRRSAAGSCPTGVRQATSCHPAEAGIRDRIGTVWELITDATAHRL